MFSIVVDAVKPVDSRTVEVSSFIYSGTSRPRPKIVDYILVFI